MNTIFYSFVETKPDDTDVISVSGYTIISQRRKQAFIRKSGGICVLFKNALNGKNNQARTNSDYITWLKLDESLFAISEDLILGILYISSSQSRFLNDDEYFGLETEITSMCVTCLSIFCLSGDTNARTVQICDFVTADTFLAGIMDLDDDTLSFYNQATLLPTLVINKHRVSEDHRTNNDMYKLLQ